MYKVRKFYPLLVIFALFFTFGCTNVVKKDVVKEGADVTKVRDMKALERDVDKTVVQGIRQQLIPDPSKKIEMDDMPKVDIDTDISRTENEILNEVKTESSPVEPISPPMKSSEEELP